MSHASRIEALRRLAERPGTEHEGAVAREMLRKLIDKQFQSEELRKFTHVRDILDNWEAWSDARLGTVMATCPCGTDYEMFPNKQSCWNLDKHIAYKIEISKRFPVGSTAYYSCWAYEPNDECEILRRTPKAASDDWRWVRVKFKRLKTSRTIPIISELGFHLFSEPVSAKRAEELRKP